MTDPFDSSAPPHPATMVPPPPSSTPQRPTEPSPFSREIKMAFDAFDDTMRSEMHKLYTLILRRDHYTQARLRVIEDKLGIVPPREPPEPT